MLYEVITNLAPGPWGYLVGGTETETTVRRNRHALDSIAFRPRVLRDMRRIDVGSDFLGARIRLPVLLAPVGGMESFVEGGAAAGEGRYSVRLSHAWREPGTWFPTLRVATQREGDAQTPYARIRNLGRA